jgi:DNA-binding LytR/AlgR family response regulator
VRLRNCAKFFATVPRRLEFGTFAMREFAKLQGDTWLGARAAEMLLAVAIAPAFAWMNPFISDRQSFMALLGFWGGLLASWFIMMAIVDRLLDMLDIVRRTTLVVRRVIVIAVAAVPMILIAGAATHALKGWTITPSEIVEIYFQIVLIGSGVALIAVAAFSPRSERAAPVIAEPALSYADDECSRPADMRHRDVLPGADGRLIGRIPLAQRGRILCLAMEDHYVRVHTDRGSALVLLRLSDAIAEAEAATPGRQVHRSWWVSDEAVERFERAGRTGQVHLQGGIRVPVSQRYLKSVDDAWCSSTDTSKGMPVLVMATQQNARGHR